MIDLFYPYVPDEAITEVIKVLHSRFIGQGPMVDRFEREFALYFHTPYAVSTNSGTSALDTAYDIIGIKRGDIVISTPLTCTATNLMLLRRQARIVWADIREDTLCIDAQDIIHKLEKYKAKAVVQVHLGGIQADTSQVKKVYPDIPIVSDSCQALGIFTGDYSCCSFQAIKHITTGDGGMICFHSLNAERDRNNARLLRWFGIDRNKKIKNNWQAYRERQMTFDIKLPGAKRHMTDIAAAMGIVGLKHYNHVIEYRKRLFDLYKSYLSKINGIKLIDGAVNTYWLLTVLVERRDDFARMLFEADIDTNVVQVRNDIYKIFGGKRAELPVMNKIEESYISLPLNMKVTEEDVHYICGKIKEGW